MNEKQESHLEKRKKKNPNWNPLCVVSVTNALEEISQLMSD